MSEKRIYTVHIMDVEAERGGNTKFSVTADVVVPGLGTVKIKDCLSSETIEKISSEVIFTLEQKMSGGKL